MNEKPIIFSTEMVRAILNNRKTQTRRVIKPQPPRFVDYFEKRFEKRGDGFKAYMVPGEPADYPILYPRYHPGDILYVKETWCNINKLEFEPEYYYKADMLDPGAEDYDPSEWDWRSPIYMPREAARLFIKVTDVRVERLQQITVEGCIAEGLEIEWSEELPKPSYFSLAYAETKEDFEKLQRARVKPAFVKEFAKLWDSLNAKRGFGWSTNPWVWVIEFKRCTRQSNQEQSEG